MKLLLDTHIWVWMHIEPEKLHRRVLAAIKKADAELWLSPFSVWEVLLLAGAGKLNITDDRFAWVARALAARRAKIAAWPEHLSILARHKGH
jgi:PIN domain nuclease of toxin-antitoxin system